MFWSKAREIKKLKDEKIALAESWNKECYATRSKNADLQKEIWEARNLLKVAEESLLKAQEENLQIEKDFMQASAQADALEAVLRQLRIPVKLPARKQ